MNKIRIGTCQRGLTSGPEVSVPGYTGWNMQAGNLQGWGLQAGVQGPLNGLPPCGPEPGMRGGVRCSCSIRLGLLILI